MKVATEDATDAHLDNREKGEARVLCEASRKRRTFFKMRGMIIIHALHSDRVCLHEESIFISIFYAGSLRL